LAEGGKREVEKGFHLWPATIRARLKRTDQKKKIVSHWIGFASKRRQTTKGGSLKK